MLATLAEIKNLIGISGTSEDNRIRALINVADRIIKTYCGCDIEAGTYGGASPAAVANGPGDAGYYSGDDGECLIVRQRPITDVTSIYLDSTGRFGDNPDGAFASSTLLTEGTHYVVRWDGTLPGSTTRCSYSGIIERLDGVWPGLYRYRPGSINPSLGNHRGNIKIAYTAGYSTVPDDLKYAMSLVVSYMRQTTLYGGDQITSESYEDYSYKLGGHGGGGGGSGGGAIMKLPEVRAILSRYRDVYI